MATSRKNIPDPIWKKIIVMAASGHTTAEIMQATGQTAPTVSNVCKEANVSITRKQEKSTDEKRDMVIDLYTKGYSPTEITCETLIPVSTVRRYIREAKIITFHNTEAHAAEETDQPIQLQLCGDDKDYKVLEALCLMRDCITMLIEAKMA